MTMTSPPSGLWPQLDFSVSKLTGLTRAHWAARADAQLLAVRSIAVTGGIALPGPTSCSGVRCDRLEGVARTFLLAAFRAGEGKDVDPFGHLRFYCQLISEGARSAHDGSWPRAYENRQVVVEGASIALSLLLTRNTVWSWVSESVRRDIFLWLDLFLTEIEALLSESVRTRGQALSMSVADSAQFLVTVLNGLLAGARQPSKDLMRREPLYMAATLRAMGIDDGATVVADIITHLHQGHKRACVINYDST